MKKSFLILLFILLPFTIFAGPFGLKMGMTLEEVTEACGGTKPKKINDDCYQITPAQKHPLFNEYMVFIDNENGLYKIKAKTEKIFYESELEKKFNEVEQRISKTYGKSDDLRDTDYLVQNKYWHEGYLYDACVWRENMKNDLMDVILYSTVPDYAEYYIILQYDFTNKSAVEDSQDDVL